MSEMATRAASSLALAPGQEWWTDKQRAALVQLGVKDASNADLAVFFHVAARTGLDPFARQVYMIGRREKSRDEQGREQWVTKQTIQTGIDGYRLVARRAADHAGEKLSQSAPLWMDADKRWHEAWDDEDPPRAAKVVVYRDGEPFPAVCSYREYVQTDRNGNPTSMWRRMPANQLAKCAEAQALRKAYPQELAGVYVDAEMQQADSAPRGPQRPEVPRVSVAELIEHDPSPAEPAEPSHPTSPEPVGSQRRASQKSIGKLIGLLSDLGIESDEDQRAWLSTELRREVTSRATLTQAEVNTTIPVVELMIEAQGPMPGAEG